MKVQYEEDEPPKDTCHGVYLVFCMLGFSCFTAWKIFITAYDFFSYEYPDFRFEFYFPLAFWALVVPVNLIQMKLGHLLGSLGFRINFWCITTALVLGGIPVLHRFVHDRQLTLWITLGGVALCGVGSGVLFGSSYGLGARLPPIYTQAVTTGSGVAGVVIFLVRLSTKALIKNDVITSSEVYFGIGCACMLLTALAYNSLRRLHYAQHYIFDEYYEPPLFVDSIALENDALGSLNYGTTSVDKNPLKGDGPVPYSAIHSRMWHRGLLAVCNFTLTSSMWPGLLTLARPVQHADDPTWETYYPIWIIGLFCTGDLVGRFVPAMPLMGKLPYKALWIVCLLRAGYYAFWSFNIDPHNYIKSDYAVLANAFVFALWNGYVGSLIMMTAPNAVEEHEREAAGGFMSLSLNFGIMCGCFSALLALYFNTGEFFGNGAG